MFEMCRRAVDIGLTEIGFADHLDFEPTDSCYARLDYDSFMSDIEKSRDEFGRNIIILAGVECDYQTRFHERIENWLKGKNFDYKIGSAHYVDGILLENHHLYFPFKKTAEE